MDINTVRIIILLVLFVAFIGVWIWAWSSARKTAFGEASMLPLEEDDGQIPGTGKEDQSC